MFYDDTVTLYNGYTDGLTDVEVWLPTLFTGETAVNLSITKGANITESGMNDADTAKMHVKYSALPKPYMDPIEWQKLPSADKPKYFTFTETQDFFVKGDTTAVPILSEGFYDYMKSHYDNVFKITTVDRYDHVMPHYEIGGN